MKTIVRPSARHFFWRRPALLLPLEDGRLVALDGAPRGALAGKPQTAQQPPHLRGAVRAPELDFQQRADPGQRPQLGRESARHGTGHQPLGQARLLCRRQPGWTTQRLAPPGLRIGGGGACPVRHRLPADVEGAGHLSLRHPARQHAHALAPALLQRLQIPLVLDCRHALAP